MRAIWIVRPILVYFSAKISAIENCEWFGTSSGGNIRCFPGWVTKGMCSSGKRAECSGGILNKRYTYMLHCCETKNHSNRQTNCQTIAGNTGEQINCPSQTVAYGGCNSNSLDTKCHVNEENFKNSIYCCQDPDIWVETEDKCEWLWSETTGDNLKCQNYQALAGQCSSSENAKSCVDKFGQKQAFGIKCCPYYDL